MHSMFMSESVIFWGVVAAMIALALAILKYGLNKQRIDLVTPESNENLLALYKQRMDDLELLLENGKITHHLYTISKKELEAQCYTEINSGDNIINSEHKIPKHTHWIVISCVVIVSLSFYLYLGNGTPINKNNVHEDLFAFPDRISPEQVNVNSPAPPLNEAIAGLEERLKSDPADINGWILLGQSYRHLNQNEKARAAFQKAVDLGSDEPAVIDALTLLNLESDIPENEMKLSDSIKQATNQKKDVAYWITTAKKFQSEKKFTQAVQAYEKAFDLKPEDPDIMTDLADVLAASNKMQINDRSMQLIKSALELNPIHIKALWLAGTGEMQQGRNSEALIYWQKLRSLLPQKSEDVRIIELNIAGLEKNINANDITKTTHLPTGTNDSENDNNKIVINGTVKLDKRFNSLVNKSDTVFIYVRAIQGPRMPLAILRKKVEDLPVNFSFDDSMSMIPEMKLSSFSEVEIISRISKSGLAQPASGDIQGKSSAISINNKNSQVIIIDNLLP